VLNVIDASPRRSRGKRSCAATTAKPASTMGFSYQQFAGDEAAPAVGNESNDAIRVLLALTDRTASKSVAARLSDHGFSVQTAENIEAFRGSSGDLDADVALLEWNPPDMAGIELLSRLRTCSAGMPVVLLSHGGLPAHESLALDNGASDFILKSRGVEVLVRRLKQAARAKPVSTVAPEGGLAFGKLRLDPAISRAFWDGKDLGLTMGEYGIVDLLASEPGRFVTYRAIYDRLRGEGFIAGYGPNGYWANVRSAIKRIRKKFCACDSAFDDIENYPSFGYCWKKPD